MEKCYSCLDSYLPHVTPITCFTCVTKTEPLYVLLQKKLSQSANMVFVTSSRHPGTILGVFFTMHWACCPDKRLLISAMPVHGQLTKSRVSVGFLPCRLMQQWEKCCHFVTWWSDKNIEWQKWLRLASSAGSIMLSIWARYKLTLTSACHFDIDKLLTN